MLTQQEQQHIADLASKWVRAELRLAGAKASVISAVSPKTAERTAKDMHADLLDALKEVG